MPSNQLIYVMPYIASLLVSLVVMLIAWTRRQVPGVREYVLLAVFQSITIFAYIIELLTEDLAGKIFWDDVQWVGFMGIVVAFALFALRFSRHRLSDDRRIWLVLGVLPAIFITLLLTNSLHGIVHHDEVLIPGVPFSALDYAFTRFVWVFAACSYTIMLLSFAILLSSYMRAHRVFRRQVLAVVVGTGIPLLGTVLTLIGVTFTFQRDITPLMAGLGNLFVAWGLLHYRLFQVLPVARDVVIEIMDDYVFVVDHELRLIDLNIAAHERLEQTTQQLIGQRADLLLSRWIPEIGAVTQLHEGALEVRAEEPDGVHYYDVHVSPFHDQNGDVAGRVFVARNITRQKELEVELRLFNATLEERVARGVQQVAEAYDSTLEGWARALELRDKETEGHSRRVTALAVRLAEALHLHDEEIVHIRRGALLHDIGKMGVPNGILNKNGALSDEEFAVIKEHPAIGYRLLGHINYLQRALEIPYYHHERWDGDGYPHGLRGKDIPLSARLFAVVDHWDALLSDRPYREAWPREKVVDYLIENRGVIFDAEIVDVFLAQVADLDPLRA